MAQCELPPVVASLLEKQKCLNNAIDKYIYLALSTEASKISVDTAQQQVANISSSITTLTKNTFWEATTLTIQPLVNTALRIALDLDLFNIIDQTPTTIDDIISHTSADRTLILRITRCLASFHILNEIAPYTFTSTPLSTTFTNPPVAAWFKMNYDTTIPRCSKIPTYLSQSSHRSPINPSIFNASFFAGQSMWDELSTNPTAFAIFQTAMSIADKRPAEAVPNYDFTTNLNTPPPSGITLIDIGGGHGHALTTILTAHPTLPGRIILQDLPSIITQLESRPNPLFSPLAHDFFTPQPPSLHHARWYYLRSVLHDWSDAACMQILSHLRDAITNPPPNTSSSILIAELVLPESGAEQYDTLLDMVMMPMGGMERSEGQWRELLRKVGLEIKGVTRAESGWRCVLEVGVVE